MTLLARQTPKLPESWRCRHDLSQQAYMVYDGEKLCLDCASALFEWNRDQRLCPAYLLVHGKELDKHSAWERS